MASIKEPQHVLPFVGLLTSQGFDLESLSNRLTKAYGNIIMRSTPQPFRQTDYYNKEMGDNITRQWWVFGDLCDPCLLKDMKHASNTIEQQYLNDQAGREVNIDPGIISMSNIVLASTKNYSHRIYLGKGIYAEITLLYKGRTYTSLDWTYPDYKEPATIDFFCTARKLLKDRLVNEF